MLQARIILLQAQNTNSYNKYKKHDSIAIWVLVHKGGEVHIYLLTTPFSTKAPVSQCGTSILMAVLLSPKAKSRPNNEALVLSPARQGRGTGGSVASVGTWWSGACCGMLLSASSPSGRRRYGGGDMVRWSVGICIGFTTLGAS